MSKSPITEHFNEAQLEIVTAPNRNLLVIAGANDRKRINALERMIIGKIRD